MLALEDNNGWCRNPLTKRQRRKLHLPQCVTVKFDTSSMQMTHWNLDNLTRLSIAGFCNSLGTSSAFDKSSTSKSSSFACGAGDDSPNTDPPRDAGRAEERGRRSDGRCAVDVEVRRAVADGLLADALAEDRRRFLVAAAVVAGGPIGTGEDDSVISRDSSLVKSTT